MQRRNCIIGLTIGLIAAIGWYLFRPELLFIHKRVNEQLPSSAEPISIVSSGRFHSVAHETKGMAMVYRLPDGQRVLRLTEFETSNGPDVRVYLVAADDAHDSKTVARASFVDLGEMKGNKGDQNYDVPREVDLSKYRSVSIWCRRFAVNFATAPLVAQAPRAAPAGSRR